MRKTGRTHVLAAVLVSGGLLLWSGCGGGSSPEVEAPPPDDRATESPTPESPPADESAATDAPVWEEPSEEVWIEPPPEDIAGEPISEQPPAADIVGQERPIEKPTSPKPMMANPARTPEASPEVAIPRENPIRPPDMARSFSPWAAAAREPATAPAPATAPPDEAMLPMMAPLAEGPGESPWAIAEETSPESEPDPLAPAASPPSGDVVEAPRAGDSPPAAEEPAGAADYELVTVFYGTDRSATSGAEALGPIYARGWFLVAAVVAGITLLLLVVGLWVSRSRAVIALAGLGMMATFALAAVTVADYLQAKSSTGGLERTYGNGRGELEVGTCEVSIPKRHQLGQIERPSIFRGEVYEDPRRHVVLLTVNLESPDEFHAGLRVRLDRSQRKEAFVFVHGFNVTFESAARRTAQLAYDLGFDGPPIFFSWPSQGGLLEYAVDETNVVWTVPHLKQFLVGIARNSGAESVHLIAHSMGNRALTSALQTIAYEMREEPPMFREVLLTAPDIDADVFKRDIAPAIVRTAERVTLYASSNDEALILSKQVHGYPRAGDSGQGLVVVPGIDTIDVSTVDTSLLGHSYYGDNRSVIADMVDLLREAKPPDQRRFLRPQPLGELFYWIFNPERIGIRPANPQPAVR